MCSPVATHTVQNISQSRWTHPNGKKRNAANTEAHTSG
ncbi:hypothetical protein phiPsal1_055 [Pontimonas phage phiPsal1]|nr:hypothetical protein phiPsal1_055 [Pontimonas phage phiPsal1]